MKKRNLFRTVILTLFAFINFSSCINMTDSDSGSNSTSVWGGYSYSDSASQLVTLTGRISTNGALPSQIAENLSANATASDYSRTAAPTVSLTGYFIQAVSGSETINGTVTDGSYSISLVLKKTYTVTAGLKSDDTIILKDEWKDVTPTRENAGNGTLTHDFILNTAASENTANGFVELTITVDSSIKRITTTCPDSDWGNTDENLSGTTYTLSKSKVDGDSTSGISPKVYEVRFSFYDDKSVLLYSSIQSVNVLSCLTTNKWISGGGSAEPINSSGNFEVSSALIETFARTQIYVGNTGLKLADESNVVPSDTTGTGSPYAPFATVSKAISMISALGSSSTDYTILISGEIKPKSGTTTTNFPSSLDEKVKSITICGVTGSDSDILNGEQKGSVLTIGMTKPVTIKNLTIMNGKAANGGGINISAGTIKLETGAKISGNTVSKNGGGIFINGKGICTMSGGEITGNTANDSGGAVAFEKECPEAKFTMTGGKISENEASCAGGIYARNGIVSVTGGEISGNKATGTSGGGIYCGGPVDSDPAKNGTVTVGGTAVIKGNRANKFGGGVFIEYGKSFTFEGGTIGGNSEEDANTAEQGGGIYVSGSLTMSGGVIKGNSVTEDGGGLYASGETEITGGSIESNSATGRGGGIFMNNGSLTLGGSISIPAGNDKKNDLYLITGKTVALSYSLTSSHVATITPEEYADGTPILSLAEPTSTTIADERAKFSIRQQSDQLEIFDISNEGYLTNIVFSFENTFPHGTVYGTEIHEDKTYIVIKYSYLDYDNLSLDVTNPFGSMGWSMEFTLDSATTSIPFATDLSDGYHTLSATLTKGSESVTATTRVHAMIKPVTVTVPNITAFCTRDQNCRLFLSVELYIEGKNDGTDTGRQTIKAWAETSGENGSLSKTLTTNSNSNYVTLTAPDSTFYFYTSLADDTSDSAVSCGKVNKGHTHTTRTLEQLKAGMNSSHNYSFDSQCVNSSGATISDSGRRAHYWFDANLNDD